MDSITGTDNMFADLLSRWGVQNYSYNITRRNDRKQTKKSNNTCMLNVNQDLITSLNVVSVQFQLEPDVNIEPQPHRHTNESQ